VLVRREIRDQLDERVAIGLDVNHAELLLARVRGAQRQMLKR
jgi:hypothetical protein